MSVAPTIPAPLWPGDDPALAARRGASPVVSEPAPRHPRRGLWCFSRASRRIRQRPLRRASIPTADRRAGSSHTLTVRSPAVGPCLIGSDELRLTAAAPIPCGGVQATAAVGPDAANQPLSTGAGAGVIVPYECGDGMSPEGQGAAVTETVGPCACGRVTMTVAPWPTALSARMSPCSASTRAFAMAKPRPVPVSVRAVSP